jgi:hypothetical protein
MDKETAEKAKKILDEIKILKDTREVLVSDINLALWLKRGSTGICRLIPDNCITDIISLFDDKLQKLKKELERL